MTKRNKKHNVKSQFPHSLPPFIFDSVQCVRCDFRRKFDANWSKIKHLAIFQIWTLLFIIARHRERVNSNSTGNNYNSNVPTTGSFTVFSDIFCVAGTELEMSPNRTILLLCNHNTYMWEVKDSLTCIEIKQYFISLGGPIEPHFPH
jgi:hypothetical protein